MCCWPEEAVSGVSPEEVQLSAKSREEVREANGGIPLLTELCLAIRSRGDDQGIVRRSDLCLWASRDVRSPGSTYGSFPKFGGAREPDQRSGVDGKKLVSTGRLESANE